MKHNVGSYDAAIRYVTAWVLVIVALNHGIHWAWPIVPLLVTAGLGFCPLYRLFHWDTTFTDR